MQSAPCCAVMCAGVVSFSRLGALDDLNVDLSQELIKAKKRKQEEDHKRQAAAAAAAAAAPQQQPGASSSSSSVRQPARPARQAAARSPSYEYKDLPTKNEARRWAAVLLSPGAGPVISIPDSSAHVCCEVV
jgi:hypothetical protein